MAEAARVCPRQDCQSLILHFAFSLVFSPLRLRASAVIISALHSSLRSTTLCAFPSLRLIEWGATSLTSTRRPRV